MQCHTAADDDHSWQHYLADPLDANSPRQPSTKQPSPFPHSAPTPGASTASSGDADSPGVASDSYSIAHLPETAGTSLATSPSNSHFSAFPPPFMDPNGTGQILPEGLEQLASNWYAHQQALAAYYTHAAALAQNGMGMPAGSGVGNVLSAPHSGTTTPAGYPSLPFPTSIPPPYAAAGSSIPFPTQLPQEWMTTAKGATPYPGAPPSLPPPAGLPSFPSAYPPSSSAFPPPPALNHLGQPAPSHQGVDPSLHALHASLEAQARLAAAAGSGGSNGTVFELPHQMAAPSTSSSTGAHSRSHTGPSAPVAKRSSSYLKAAHGLSVAAHSRSRTQPAQHSSPLASPALLPHHSHETYGFPSTASPVASPTLTTHQRPLPLLPPSRVGPASTAPGGHLSAAQSPLTSTFIIPNLYPTLSNGVPPAAASPPPPRPVVDYDFSSLEQDLDRFSSLSGFASAAAAAMASVSPGAMHGTASTTASAGRGSSQRKPSDSYNVGGYGGTGTPRLAHDALPSPKILGDVLSDPLFFYGSQKASPIASTGSNATTPASAAAASSTAGGAKGPTGSSPGGSAASPAGSAVIDEEGAELLSHKDPIAAQVWRMFHKAKNTMPNGARMENLTWRLMSMTLRKRREDSAGAGPAGGPPPAPGQTPSPGGEDARIQRALEEAIEEQREENEERDTVQPLGKGAKTGRMRGGRERSNSSGARSMPAPSASFQTLAQQQQAQDEEEAEEERGRRRRTKSGTASKSNSATPEAEEPADTMDWRAMSKSRSRSRAPDMMDWRAASRSRSRAPDFRVAAAPPAIDSTPAIANFSRFFNDSGSLPSTNEMPPPPLPASAAAASAPVSAAAPALKVTTSLPSTAVPLPMPSLPDDDNQAALAELATSLGLSPQDQAQLFGSASARFDGHSLFDLPSPGAIASPPPPIASVVGSPLTVGTTAPPSLSASPQPNTFSFPTGLHGSGPDPNLAAIETTLNQLISLQHLSHPSPVSSPTSSSHSHFTETPSSFVAAKSPLSASFTPDSFTALNKLPHLPSLPSTSAANLSSSVPASGLGSSQAQQHLQQFAPNRKPSNLGASTSSAPASRRASASSPSPYLNATTLAQSNHRNHYSSFGAAASAAAGGTTPTPASGLSLARPPHLSTEVSQPSTPYSEAAPSHFFPSSAPVQPAVFGSPNPPLFGEGTDTAHLLYDYFHSAHNAAPFLPSPYVNAQQLETFGSAPSGVDPSQLFNNAFGGPTAAASPYGSEGSSWGVSPRSAMESPAAIGSPEDEKTTTSKAKRPVPIRANSAGSMPSSAVGKAKSAPTSRVHSRSNTISLPSTIQEGKTLDLDASSDDKGGSEKKAAVSVSKAPKKDAADGGPTQCLNCQTTNTPLWRRDTEGRPLCNACGLFRNLHGVDRPANLNTGVIKKRNRKSGPKDPNAKKSTARAAARKNSISGLSSGGSGAAAKKERAGAGAPYPNAAVRAQQQQD
ncbi:hypothetical protein JCM11641_004208 [Rhodosporidiobolus odoratus]